MFERNSITHCILGRRSVAMATMLMISAWSAGPIGQKRDSASAGTGVIRGYVVQATNGAPLADAVVRAVEGDSKLTKAVVSDVHGAYEFDKLPAGRYLIVATKAGYVSGSFGQVGAGAIAKPVTLMADQSVAGINVRIWHAGVIAGFVTDDFGQPAVGTVIALMRPSFESGQRRLLPLRATASTTDTGEFRIVGVDPGTYYLVASPGRQLGPGAVVRPEGLAPTFFPGTTSIDDAQPITVRAEETVNEAVSLVRVRYGTITGEIPPGPWPARLQAVHVRQESLPGSTIVSTDANGRFTARDLTPGRYVLHTGVIVDPTTKAQLMFVGHATVGPNGQGMSGVMLAENRMATIRGRVVLPTGELGVKPEIRIGTDPTSDGTIFGASPSVSVNNDLTFSVQAWPGVAHLNVQVAMPGWQLRTVRQSGRDVTDPGLTIQSGATLDKVEVELTTRPQVLSGVVYAGVETRAEDYAVVVFAQSERLRSVRRYVALGRPDQTGRFTIKTLPPGQYYVIAVPSVEVSELNDPDFLARAAHGAVPIDLKEQETQTVTLRLTRLAGSDPSAVERE